MTEKELRNNVVNIAKAWLGCKESDGSHKKIIDVYNSHKPLARGYKVKCKANGYSVNDAWCSTFVSAVSIKAGLTDIFPTECGCGKHINLFKNLNSWVENDSYIPAPADVIFYDWEDNGVGDNQGAPNHVGIVESVTNGVIKVIEGNLDGKVAYRNININGKYIRGYGVPKYASKAIKEPELNVGDTVMFNGTKHYTNSYAIAIGKSCKPGEAKITKFIKGRTHPYHLKAVSGKGSTVNGWVNEKDIAEIPVVKTYVVKKGDTLSKIASAHGTTIGVLAKINAIENVNLIKVGQIIRLP